MISLLNARKDRFTTFIKAAQTAGVADVLEQGIRMKQSYYVI